MIFALALVLVGCGPKSEPLIPVVDTPPGEAARVLVVMNEDSADSRAIASYYVKARHIPTSNVATIHVSENEDVAPKEYQKQIEDPIKEQIKKSGHKIDFIVLTRGIPIHITGDDRSVDAYLVAMDKFKTLDSIHQINETEIKRNLNPYFNKTTPFTHAEYGMYLVTRLTGYNASDAKKLVDNSVSAKPEKGLFFFDGAENRKGGGYLEMQDGMKAACKGLATSGYTAQYEDTAVFKAPDQAMAGYCSWGSNDDHFDLNAYKGLKFKPGALAETFVSTSGRSFIKANLVEGQSNICDLVADGVTGVKGYVTEPYTFALAKPQILFRNYVTLGRNLAESFYAASLVLKWKDIVIGDPLCQPYKK